VKEALEAWRYGDPADVVERVELQANAAAAREREKLEKRLKQLAEQARIRAKVFRILGAK